MMNEKQVLEKIHLRVKKADASFLYFLFESNEGLGFYSTLKNEIGSPDREILFQFHSSLLPEVKNLFLQFSKTHFIEIIDSSQEIKVITSS